MNLTEEPLAADALEQIETSLDAAYGLLQLDMARTSPFETICRLDQYVLQLQGEPAKRKSVDMEETMLTLGVLWGQQLVEQFDWQWARVTLHEHDDSVLMGVFSADRSLAIYPFLFLFVCLENRCDVTIQLAFEVLLDESRIPALPSFGYENVMDNVHHPAPRR